MSTTQDSDDLDAIADRIRAGDGITTGRDRRQGAKAQRLIDAVAAGWAERDQLRAVREAAEAEADAQQEELRQQRRAASAELDAIADRICGRSAR